MSVLHPRSRRCGSPLHQVSVVVPWVHTLGRFACFRRISSPPVGRTLYPAVTATSMLPAASAFLSAFHGHKETTARSQDVPLPCFWDAPLSVSRPIHSPPSTSLHPRPFLVVQYFGDMSSGHAIGRLGLSLQYWSRVVRDTLAHGHFVLNRWPDRHGLRLSYSCASLPSFPQASLYPTTPAELTTKYVGDGDGDDAGKLGKENPNFHLNVGRAIDVLRTELPYFFENGLVRYDIYHDDIVFTEPHHYKFYVMGKTVYRYLLNTARFILKWYFTDATLNVVSVTQSAMDNKILVRWVMEGTPRTSLFRMRVVSSLEGSGSALSGLTGLGTHGNGSHQAGSGRSSSASSGQGPGHSLVPEGYVEKSVYEGISVYRFNSEGIIVEHAIENVLPAPKKFAPLMAIGWWQRGRMTVVELNTQGTST
jgi:hypothetical protein